MSLAALIALSACSAAPGDEALDESIASVESAARAGKTSPPTVTLKRGLSLAELELECELSYGPVLKVKPQGLVDDGSDEPQAGVVYGPVITIKPKGFNGEGYDCPINQGDVVLKRDFGGALTEPELECGLSYGPIIKIKPKGGLTETAGEGQPTYGPIITVKPKGFAAGDEGHECAVRYPNLVLKKGFGEMPQAAMECSEPGPLLSLAPARM